MNFGGNNLCREIIRSLINNIKFVWYIYRRQLREQGYNYRRNGVSNPLEIPEQPSYVLIYVVRTLCLSVTLTPYLCPSPSSSMQAKPRERT